MVQGLGTPNVITAGGITNGPSTLPATDLQYITTILNASAEIFGPLDPESVWLRHQEASVLFWSVQAVLLH